MVILQAFSNMSVFVLIRNSLNKNELPQSRNLACLYKPKPINSTLKNNSAKF